MKKIDGVLTEVTDEDLKLLEKKPKKFWKSVETIGLRAFAQCKQLTHIEIPEGIKQIDELAFSNLPLLTSVKLPDSVDKIGRSCFVDCLHLKDINLPNKIKRIEEYTFFGCEDISSITLPDTIEFIGRESFSTCFNLTIENLPANLKHVGKSAFGWCKKITCDLPSGIQEIEENAFKSCKFDNLTIPYNITTIKNDTFTSCKINSVTMSNNVECIEEFAFSDNNFKKINLPQSLKTIKPYAFTNCSNLTDIEIPSSVETLDSHLFEYCDSMNTVTISDTTKYVDPSFLDGSVIKTVLIKSEDKTIAVPANVFSTIALINGNNEFSKAFKFLKNKQFKKYNALVKKIEHDEYDQPNIQELFKLGSVLGLFENDNATLKMGKNNKGQDNIVKASDLAYDLMQKMFVTNKSVEFKDLHMELSRLPWDNCNPALLKFLTNKNNFSDFTNDISFLPELNQWFKERKNLVLESNNEFENFPTTEENRYKILDYVECEDGHYKNKWLTPTIALIKKELSDRKYFNITPETKPLADHLSQYSQYKEQKFFDKAVEIQNEWQENNQKGEVAEHILSNHLKEDVFDSIEKYKQETEKLKNNILQNCESTLNNQAESAKEIYTYEMLPKNSVENFSIGLMTSCCASLFGAGAGAQRATIVHPDLQSMVIRDKKDNIVAFGIIYVNRQKQYAVVNDVEVNRKYDSEQTKEKIYKKFMEGIDAFANAYNDEYEDAPLKQINCGLSPNWGAINDFIKQNPEGEILQAVNFDSYKYAGQGYWPGDWQKKQHVIWEQKNNKDLEL